MALGNRNHSKVGHRRNMEADARPGRNPYSLGLDVEPALLAMLRAVGLDLLAYDGVPCSDAAGPLMEAASRIETDTGPGLIAAEGAAGSNVAEGLRWAAELCADRLPGVKLRVRTRGWDCRALVGLRLNGQVA